MTDITRREAIEALKGMFETNKRTDDNLSMMSEGEDDTATFWLDKKKYPREGIVDRLREYFKDKNIVDGLCRIDGITFVFTTVEIAKRSAWMESI